MSQFFVSRWESLCKTTIMESKKGVFCGSPERALMGPPTDLHPTTSTKANGPGTWPLPRKWPEPRVVSRRRSDAKEEWWFRSKNPLILLDVALRPSNGAKCKSRKINVHFVVKWKC